MKELLKGKVALITGGSRGIGKGMVERFAACGADIAFTYRSSKAQAEALAKALSSGAQKVRAYHSDAASFEGAGELVQQVTADFEKIDIVINNAGIARDNLLLRMKEEEWDSVLETNLKSVFNLTKHISRHFLKQRQGVIINITSVIGLSGNAGQSNYAASKAGIIGFTKSVAKELASRNVRCNAIAPGFIETEMTGQLDEKMRKEFVKQIPLQRYGTTEDVANAALFLASDLGSYVNGQVLSVCGGLHT